MIGLMVSFTFVGSAWGVTRTYLSTKGNDTGSCPLTAPCKTLSYAVGLTDLDGEVVILDTGVYGSVTITKGISIIASLKSELFVPSGGSGITVNAGASDVVIIKGLTIKGAAGAIAGME
jgi:hypothetical protein